MHGCELQMWNIVYHRNYILLLDLSECSQHDSDSTDNSLALCITLSKTRALRAHTPRVPCICIIVQLGHMLSTTFTYTYEASRESCT